MFTRVFNTLNHSVPQITSYTRLSRKTTEHMHPTPQRRNTRPGSRSTSGPQAQSGRRRQRWQASSSSGLRWHPRTTQADHHPPPEAPETAHKKPQKPSAHNLISKKGIKTQLRGAWALRPSRSFLTQTSALTLKVQNVIVSQLHFKVSFLQHRGRALPSALAGLPGAYVLSPSSPLGDDLFSNPPAHSSNACVAQIPCPGSPTTHIRACRT